MSHVRFDCGHRHFFSAATRHCHYQRMQCCQVIIKSSWHNQKWQLRSLNSQHLCDMCACDWWRIDLSSGRTLVISAYIYVAIGATAPHVMDGLFLIVVWPAGRYLIGKKSIKQYCSKAANALCIVLTDKCWKLATKASRVISSCNERAN